MSRVFLDTNVLACQFDSGEPEKRELVSRLLADSPHTFVISTQVLLELFVVLARELRGQRSPGRRHIASSGVWLGCPSSLQTLAWC